MQRKAYRQFRRVQVTIKCLEHDLYDFVGHLLQPFIFKLTMQIDAPKKISIIADRSMDHSSWIRADGSTLYASG